MDRRFLVMGVLALGGLFLSVIVLRRPLGLALATAAFERAEPDESTRGRLDALFGAREQREPAQHQPLPEGLTRPTNERELADYVAWMRSLGHDELLRLSNAEFSFDESELVGALQQLQGDWVVKALGELAAAEADPLMKAILVEGLFGVVSYDRLDDGNLLPILERLLVDMSLASGDPYEVASDLALYTYGACARGHADYAQLMGAVLAGSDNRELLVHGYMSMGLFPGSEGTLASILTTHTSDAGRFGALEGLRNLAVDGLIAPERITALGLEALANEANERNRLLLYEMMVSTGGEAALSAIEQAWRAGELAEVDKTAVMLAMEMDPARANALFLDTLRAGQLTGEARQAIYNAMGVMEGEEGARFLLDLVRNPELDETERLAGLRGLWNREVDEDLAGELESVLETSEDPALRTEALRMLVHGEPAARGVDLRKVATLDDDAAVRAEAVQLAAMQPSADTREWLEERLLEDDSLDVKAAALGALVYQAHYTGDGEAVLGYLSRARKFTDDEGALAMIAQGEQMVKDYDPRNLDLGLAKEAEFYGTLARYTDGPTARAFERQARQLSGIVAALRGSLDGRRSAQR